MSHVSPCYPYRGLKEGESNEQYVARLAQELEDQFQRVGPETVCGFVAETVAGLVSPRLHPFHPLHLYQNRLSAVSPQHPDT